MNETSAFAFWAAVATLLVAARAFAWLARAASLPAFVGEMAAGIALGPSVLGRLAPGAHAWLLARDATADLVAGTSAVAAGVLLAASGFEVDLRRLRRSGRRGALTSVAGAAAPAAAAAVLGLCLPATLIDPGQRPAVALALAAVLAAAPLPAAPTAGTDFGLLESEVGRLATVAAAVDGVVFWTGLPLLLGPAAGGQVVGGLAARLAVDRSPRWRRQVRAAMGRLVDGVCAPLFVAATAMRIDVPSLDPGLCGAGVALVAAVRLGGVSLGARVGGMPWRQAAAVGAAVCARGTMSLVAAETARRAGLVTGPLFDALAFATLVASAMTTPVSTLLVHDGRDEEDVVALLRRGAFVGELSARTPSEAIAELVRALGSLLAGVKRRARDAVLERELVAATGLGDEIAIPHAAIEGLERPLLALGRAPHGIDFDAPDGRPARFVFLLLIPPNAHREEVRILASIARAMLDARARDELARAGGLDEVTRALSEGARRTRESLRPPRRAQP
jgi:Kef-type K+ transport system membrane component KefB